MPGPPSPMLPVESLTLDHAYMGKFLFRNVRVLSLDTTRAPVPASIGPSSCHSPDLFLFKRDLRSVLDRLGVRNLMRQLM